MDPGVQLAYELPAVYRRVLDRLAELERAGRRDHAVRIRRKALRLYATSWDPGTLRRMRELLDETGRAVAEARAVGGNGTAAHPERAAGPAEPAPG
jgi:hypothetical protein